MNELDILLGVFIGVVTGIIPGLHVNLLIPFLGNTILLLGIAVSHTFFDFIPSLFLGVPDEGSAVASLPGHRLVMKGDGIKAFRATAISGFLSSLLFVLFLPLAYSILRSRLVVLVLVVLVFSLVLFSSRSIGVSIGLALASAGLFYLFDGYLSSTAMFVAFFSGLFGIPTLINAFVSDSRIPEQVDGIPRVRISFAFLASFLGLIAGLLPGITSSMTGLVADLKTEMEDMARVFLLGGINTVYLLSSFLAIWIIGRPRSGVAIALEGHGITLIPALFVAVSSSFLLAWFIGPWIARIYARLVNRTTNLVVMTIVSGIVISQGGYAFLLFLASSSLGIIAYYLRIRRTVCMSFIILPVILNYFL